MRLPRQRDIVQRQIGLEAGASLESALTAKEREVIHLLMHGACNKEVAAALRMSVRTVEFHISNMLRKAGVTSRLELVTHFAGIKHST